VFEKKIHEGLFEANHRRLLSWRRREAISTVSVSGFCNTTLSD